MGVNDQILGPGWSCLLHEFPRARRIETDAVCYLSNHNRFKYIQIHGLWSSAPEKFSFEVYIDGERVGQKKLRCGWHTYLIPIDRYFESNIIELRISLELLGKNMNAGGFAINEVGVFGLGSPLLRLVD